MLLSQTWTLLTLNGHHLRPTADRAAYNELTTQPGNHEWKWLEWSVWNTTNIQYSHKTSLQYYTLPGTLICIKLRGNSCKNQEQITAENTQDSLLLWLGNMAAIIYTISIFYIQHTKHIQKPILTNYKQDSTVNMNHKCLNLNLSLAPGKTRQKKKTVKK